MDAIILVGGQGTRLRPLTHSRHKSLVPVANRPAIAHLFEWTARSGFDRAVLAIGQHNEDLAAAYPAGRHHGVEVALVTETQRLESGGGIRNAVTAAGVEGRFVVLNGDVFVEIDFRAMLAAHVAFGARLTQYLTPVDDPSQFGVAVVGPDGAITGYVEKPPIGEAPSNLINAGVWIFEPELLGEYPTGAVRVEETLFPSLVARRQRVLGHTSAGLWADIGTPARYLALNRALVAREPTSNVIAAGVAMGDARVNESSVGQGCTLGSRASVEGSILWEGVTVHAAASISGSILADRVTVGEGATVAGAVIGSGAVVPAGVRVPAGTTIEPGAHFGG